MAAGATGDGQPSLQCRRVAAGWPTGNRTDGDDGRVGRAAMRNILITGGSDGIGLAAAKLLAARADTRVTLVARNDASLRQAVTQLPGTGHDFVVADLSQAEAVAIG